MGIEDIFEAILGGAQRKQEQKQSSSGGSQRRRRSSLEPMPEPKGDGSIGDAMKSVVQIVAMKEGYLGGMSSAWTGSGTIVHPQGLILTNCHVANPRAMGMSSPKADRLAIAITDRSDEPPAVSYFAQVIECDPRLDLAVIRIVADVKGRRTNNLNLPAVHLGDSDTLDLGQRISIFGFPGIGGETITFTSGNVSGFISESGIQSSRAWIKTDATIAGGNSGGTAVNDEGFLVGVPTQAAAGAGVTPVDARPVVDTNRDGRVDQRDTPMAIGGFINGLRPINLALPLLEKAGMPIERDRRGRSGRGHNSLPTAPPTERRYERPREKASMDELLFSTRITSDGRPINPSNLIPSAASEVFATFEFSAMRDGMEWTATWVTDGKKIIEKEDVWNDGPEGRKAVEIAKDGGIPDGEYHLVVSCDGQIMVEGKMMVGTPIDESDSEISGRLVDERSGRAIANGIVIVLKPTASLRRFMNSRDRDAIFSSVETGRDGTFTLPDQLPKGQAYSLVAAASGYEPLTIEGALRLGPGAPENADLGDIELAEM